MKSETEIKRLIESPCTSYWLKDAFKALLQRDVLDAARDAQVLADLLGQRADEVLNGVH